MRFPVLLAAFALLAATAFSQTPAEMTKYGKDYEVAKKALAAKPKDKKVRAKFVETACRYGTASMYSPSVPPRVKYRQALRLYREVLKIDPKNKEASNNSKMIIDIYKQMGRPVPN
jgi:hypothetical protein